MSGQTEAKPGMKSASPASPLSRAWGLTGGIASGKSTAARLFEEAGFFVIDADQIARQLSGKGGAAYEPIIQRFGTADRTKLRELIFSDPAARKDLEAILHPLIQQESLKLIQGAAPRPVIYEAALLVETGRYKDFRGLIVVEAPRDQRKKRLMERDHCSVEMADRILSSQLSDEKRNAAATYLLQNSGTIDELRSKVENLALRLKTDPMAS